MAVKKKNGDEELDSGFGRNDGTEEAPAVEASTNPPLSDYCIVVNLTRGSLGFPLVGSGRRINLGPMTRGMELHKSPPILKKDRPEMLFHWEKQGMIRFEPVTGGESA